MTFPKDDLFLEGFKFAESGGFLDETDFHQKTDSNAAYFAGYDHYAFYTARLSPFVSCIGSSCYCPLNNNYFSTTKGFIK